MRKRAAALVLRRPTASLPATLLACALLGSLSASAATIPPDLAARADQLRREASPQVLAWVGEQARALAKGHGPVDVAVLQAAARSRFGTRQAVSGKSAASPATAQVYPNLGSMGDGDIMAMAFIVMMECAKSAEEDLKAIMEDVKAANKRKAELREAPSSPQKTTSTPTPGPDRTAQFVAKARKLAGKTQGAQLSRVAPR
jgi:hypothetical protein